MVARALCLWGAVDEPSLSPGLTCLWTGGCTDTAVSFQGLYQRPHSPDVEVGCLRRRLGYLGASPRTELPLRNAAGVKCPRMLWTNISEIVLGIRRGASSLKIVDEAKIMNEIQRLVRRKHCST